MFCIIYKWKNILVSLISTEISKPGKCFLLHICNNYGRRMIGQGFRLKKIVGIRNCFIKETKQNKLINKKHKNILRL